MRLRNEKLTGHGEELGLRVKKREEVRMKSDWLEQPGGGGSSLCAGACKGRKSLRVQFGVH